MVRTLIVFSFVFVYINCFAQVNFKKEYLSNNPVENRNLISAKEVIKTHEEYLAEASAKKDTLKQIYGLFYLFADYYRNNDYVEIKKIILEAEKLIGPNSPPEWQGALKMRKAYFLEIVNKDLQGALNEYKEAIPLCEIAKDTLCLAESLEQLSNINKNLGNYDLAEKYFQEAIVLMEEHATPSGIALAYSNYSLLLSDQGQYPKALNYIEKAIEICSEQLDTFNLIMYISNKASILYKQGKYNEAVKLYKEVMPINIKNNWPDNLLYNYAGLLNSYDGLGQFQNSNEYLQKYYELKDSLTGVEVQKKINQLELNDQLRKNELVLSKKEAQLTKSKYQRDRLIGALVLFLLVALILFLFWYSSKKYQNEQRINNLNYIHDLKRILKLRNKEIREISESIDLTNDSSNNADEGSEESKPGMKSPSKLADFKLFDFRIVNDEGINTFKSYFDKIYPGMLFRVRKTYPTITNAEERLLMLFKLNIKSNEAAEILGISQSSVKKTRNRLRKRLEIEPSVDLEEFIKKIT